MGAACLYLTIAMVATTVLIHIVYDARSKRGFFRVYTTETTVIFLLINRQLALHSISKKKKKNTAASATSLSSTEMLWNITSGALACPTRVVAEADIFFQKKICAVMERRRKKGRAGNMLRDFGSWPGTTCLPTPHVLVPALDRCLGRPSHRMLCQCIVERG